MTKYVIGPDVAIRLAHDQAVIGDEHQILAPTLLRGVVVGGLPCLPPGEQVKSQRDLFRTPKLAASVLGDGDEPPLLRFPRGEDTVPSRQRLAAVAMLADWEAGLSAVQPLALVDAAAWWLTDSAGAEPGTQCPAGEDAG